VSAPERSCRSRGRIASLTFVRRFFHRAGRAAAGNRRLTETRLAPDGVTDVDAEEQGQCGDDEDPRCHPQHAAEPCLPRGTSDKPMRRNSMLLTSMILHHLVFGASRGNASSGKRGLTPSQPGGEPDLVAPIE